MLVDGTPVSEEAVTAWAARLELLALERQASFFEVTTAVAFADFAARGVEIAVVEVGLGGRLDATNVVEPLACGVTRIALEHTDYLGPTLQGIAAEKAGIAKTGVPFFTTETDPRIVAVLRAGSEERGARFEVVDPTLAAGRPLGLVGPYQVANASLAVALGRSLPTQLRPDQEAESSGLLWARLPGRFDRRGSWIFDVAHNPDGVRALVSALRQADPPRPLTAVVAVLKDKAWREMLTLLAPAVDRMVLTRAESAPAERAWDLHEAGDWCRVSGVRATAVPDLGAALREAREGAATVLVTGSFHTVGDAMQELPGFSPLD